MERFCILWEQNPHCFSAFQQKIGTSLATLPVPSKQTGEQEKVHNVKLTVRRNMGARGGGAQPTVLRRAAADELPQHKAAGIHVDAQELVLVEADGAFQHLRRHVATGAHLKTGRRDQTTRWWSFSFNCHSLHMLS